MKYDELMKTANGRRALDASLDLAYVLSQRRRDFNVEVKSDIAVRLTPKDVLNGQEDE